MTSPPSTSPFRHQPEASTSLTIASCLAAAAATSINITSPDGQQVKISVGNDAPGLDTLVGLFKFQSELQTIARVKASKPDNLAMKHFDFVRNTDKQKSFEEEEF